MKTPEETFLQSKEWYVGRELTTGVAIDALRSRVIDDAISIETEDENLTLNVSVADIGSFWREQSDRVCYCDQFRARRSRSMNPVFRFSKEAALAFSLTPGCERPTITTSISFDSHKKSYDATIFKSVTKVQRLSLEEANGLLIDESVAAMQGLSRVAETVAIMQQKKGIRRFGHEVASNKSDELLAPQVVEEAMIAANAAIANFMFEHEIPALYRSVSGVRESGEPKIDYSVDPGSPLWSGIDRYVRCTSPLRRFFDFVNQCNLAAYLDDRPFPYGANQLEKMLNCLNRDCTVGREPSSYSDLCNIAEKLKSDQKPDRDEVAALLFASIENKEERRGFKRQAAKLIANNPQLTFAVIRSAISKAYLMHEVEWSDDSGVRIVFRDKFGNTYPIPTEDTQRDYELLIGKIANVKMDSLKVPEEFLQNILKELKKRGIAPEHEGHNIISVLEEFLATLYKTKELKHYEYDFLQAKGRSPKNMRYRCVLKVVDADGEESTTIGRAGAKSLAKQIAAAKMLLKISNKNP